MKKGNQAGAVGTGWQDGKVKTNGIHSRTWHVGNVRRCAHCGKEFVREMRGQTRYCCAECREQHIYETRLNPADAFRQKIKKMKKKKNWKLEREDVEMLVKEGEKVHVNVCRICGKEIHGAHNVKTCSKTCKTELDRIAKGYQWKDGDKGVCPVCGKEFIRNHTGQHKYCSPECLNKTCGKRTQKTCVICGKPLPHREGRGHGLIRYCSPECKEKRFGTAICLECGKTFPKRANQKNVFCSRECMGTYNMRKLWENGTMKKAIQNRKPQATSEERLASYGKERVAALRNAMDAVREEMKKPVVKKPKKGTTLSKMFHQSPRELEKEDAV